MRKLATIQRITNIRPIPGADKIEVADVLGWSVVVGKDEFKAGDLAVYFEIDSWLDATNPAFKSFEERFVAWGTKRGMRLKTIKLRKQISQGLLMPISAFPELEIDGHATHEPAPMYWAEGVDVTEILKIEKWEPAEETSSNGGQAAGVWPAFLRKTDQERVQNVGSQLVKHINDSFEVTIKLDGSSMTVYCLRQGTPEYNAAVERAEAKALKEMGWLGVLKQKIKSKLGLDHKPASVMGVCSRNSERDIDGDDHFAAYVREHKVLEKLQNWCIGSGFSLAVQGELVAPSIQGNYEKVVKPEFYVFDIFDIERQEYLKPAHARAMTTSMGLNYVPVVSVEQQLSCFPDVRCLIDSILAEAEGRGMNKDVKREGLVYKSNQHDFSFKAISQSYLLKKG